MRLRLGLFLSLLLHIGFIAYALFLGNDTNVQVNMNRPVYTVDLISLAPPPTAPAPVVEVIQKSVEVPSVPTVEAAPESTPVVVQAPAVEAKAEPKIEDISPKKVKKKTLIKKKKEEPKVTPKPKPKPKKTAQQLRQEALAAAQAAVRREEQKKAQALQKELAALKKQEGDQVYSHGAQDGKEGGVVGGTGSGLSEVYSLIVGLAIKKNWRYPTFSGEANLLTVVELTLAEDGKILSSIIRESSGNSEFDNSTLRAIKETQYVERPRTERDRILLINFNSQELSE